MSRNIKYSVQWNESGGHEAPDTESPVAMVGLLYICGPSYKKEAHQSQDADRCRDSQFCRQPEPTALRMDGHRPIYNDGLFPILGENPAELARSDSTQGSVGDHPGGIDGNRNP